MLGFIAYAADGTGGASHIDLDEHRLFQRLPACIPDKVRPSRRSKGCSCRHSLSRPPSLHTQARSKAQ